VDNFQDSRQGDEHSRQRIEGREDHKMTSEERQEATMGRSGSAERAMLLAWCDACTRALVAMRAEDYEEAERCIVAMERLQGQLA
jgi:hypothetical protein